MLEAIVSVLGAAMLAIFGWAFNLNSKVNVQEQRYSDFLHLIDTKFDSFETLVESKFEGSNQRLVRIERALNGALHHNNHGDE